MIMPAKPRRHYELRVVPPERTGKRAELQVVPNHGLTREEVVAVGDGANDEIMLQNAGFGIAFNAYEILQKVADGRLTQNNLRGLLYCLGATEQTVRQAIEQKGVDAEKTAH